MQSGVLSISEYQSVLKNFESLIYSVVLNIIPVSFCCLYFELGSYSVAWADLKLTV